MNARGRAFAIRSASVLAVISIGLTAAPRAGAEVRTALAVAAPVLKWQRGGCFSSWCQTGWYSSPAVADLDGDGVREIVIVGNVYNCGTNPYTSLYQMPFVFRLDRTRASGAGWDWTVLPTPGAGSGPLSEDYDVIETVPPNPALADLDGDGKKEILFPSYDGKLHAYGLDRTEHGSWPYDVPGTGIRFANEPVVADLDADGRAEVLFTSWPQKSVGGTGQLHVLDYLGNSLHAVGLPAPFGGATWNGALGAPTLADVDGDGDLPGTSNLSFGAGRTRANNAVVELARDGTRTLWVKSSAPSERSFSAASWPRRLPSLFPSPSVTRH